MRHGLLGLVVLASGFASLPALAQSTKVQPYVTYRNNRVELFLRATELVPEIQKGLATLPWGEIHRTESQKASVRNPRVTFKDDAISLRVNYSAGTRGWTSVPAPTFTNPGRKVKVHTPWVTDSGWFEVDLRTHIANGVLHVHTRNGYVRWSSNNKFTNLVGQIYDNKIRQQAADKVNAAVRHQVGSKTGYVGGHRDLRRDLVNLGVGPIARKSGVPESKVRDALNRNINRLQVDARCRSDGILIYMSIPEGIIRRP